MTEHRVDLSQLARVRDGSGHSVFGASGNAHFLLCQGALIPNLLIKDDGNEDAAYGSIAHGVTEEWLLTGRRPEHLVGTTQTKDGFEIEIDDEMLAHAQECVDRCEWEPGFQIVEYRVDYSDLTPIPNQGGTMDFAALTYRRAVVTDHKFGKAEMIVAEENYQLMLYAYGIYRAWDWLFDFQEFVIRINQPRLGHFDEWVCSRERLLEFAAWARERMHGAWKLDAPRTAGEKQCRYCKIKSSCTANAKLQADLTEGIFIDETISAEDMRSFKQRLEDDFDEFRLNIVDAGHLTTSNIATLYKHRKTAEKFWKSLAAELFRRAQAGEDMGRHGFKLVQGRSNRAYVNESKARARLISLGVPAAELEVTSLVSPTVAEKLLRKHGRRLKDLPELLQGYVYKPEGKATLAPLSDRRPAIVDFDAIVFDDETTSEHEEL